MLDPRRKSHKFEGLESFRKADDAISDALSIASTLKPEVQILIELYESEQSEGPMTLAMLEMVSRIPASTLRRYLVELEKRGAVSIDAHPVDPKMTVARLSPDLRRTLAEVFESEEWVI